MTSESLPLLPETNCGSIPGSVPVFNCIVILTPLESGGLKGRIANLPDISAEGNTERDLLMLLTRRFKTIVKNSLDQGSPLQWIDPPEAPEQGESQRFIPVHL